MKIKILLFGNEPTSFMNPVANELRKCGLFEIDVWDIANDRQKPKEVLENFYNYLLPKPPSINLNNYSTINKTFAILNISFWRYLFSDFVFHKLVLKNSLSIILKNALRKTLIGKQFSNVFDKYDIINFHLISTSILFYLKFVPKKKKLILSFWGSDAYKNTDEYNYLIQQRAIERADLLTAIHLEMKETLLAKFGRHLKPKIHEAMVGFDQQVIELMTNLNKNEQTAIFKQKHSIAQNKIVVSIGNCARKSENHDIILKQLSLLDKTIKDKIAVVLMLTYDRHDKEHLNKIDKIVATYQIQTILLEKLLTVDEIASIRLASDISIRLQENDALSITLLESLFANQIAITGSWLPYRVLHRKGIYLIEIDKPEDLSIHFSEIIENLDFYMRQIENNKKYVSELITIKPLAEKWNKIYKLCYESR